MQVLAVLCAALPPSTISDAWAASHGPIFPTYIAALRRRGLAGSCRRAGPPDRESGRREALRARGTACGAGGGARASEPVRDAARDRQPLQGRHSDRPVNSDRLPHRLQVEWHVDFTEAAKAIASIMSQNRILEGVAGHAGEARSFAYLILIGTCRSASGASSRSTAKRSTACGWRIRKNGQHRSGVAYRVAV